MRNKKHKRKKKQKNFILKIIKTVLNFFILVIRNIIDYLNKISKKDEIILKSSSDYLNSQKELKKDQSEINKEAEYFLPKIIKSDSGNFRKFEDFLFNKSSIGLILGSRGSGKTALGLRLLENIKAKTNKNIYTFGIFSELPSWINKIDNINRITNTRDNSIILIDEAGINLDSRDFMKTSNKILSKLLLISRHKDISILFITQNSSNIDLNIIRQLDFMIFKKSSLMQLEFERKKIKEIYLRIDNKILQEKAVSYIYSNIFSGYIKTNLPSFWSNKISKSYKEIKIDKKEK